MSFATTRHHYQMARLASQAGLMAIGSAILGALITGLLYIGRTQEHYSIFNHFISELGNYQWSRYAVVFNTGLVLAGIGLLLFLNASAMLLRSWLRYSLMFTGTLSGISCALVGVFSESYLSIHLTVAPFFFVVMFISVILYCVGVWIEIDHHMLSRWYALSGVPAFFFLFILIAQISQNAKAFLDGPRGAIFQTLYHRPGFWILPFVEWMVFLSLLGMVAFFSLALRSRSRAHMQQLA